MYKLLNTYESNNDFINVNELVNINFLHNKNIYGNNIKIAIVDSGCYNHFSLKNNIIGGKNFTNEGNENDYNDLNGHGTHVAGIIAASNNKYFEGIAPNCNLLICKALNKDGEGSLQNIVKAINYAIDNKVDIINMSFGCPNNDNELYDVIKKAINNNISVVCASGNSGDANPDTKESDYPGAYEEVIEVGSINKNFKVSDFSNNNIYVDLVAPGEDIVSTYLNDRFAQLSGTSMAAPIVSATLALLIEYTTKEFNRRLTESELYSTLIKNTKSTNDLRCSQGHGYLYINSNNVL